jgi:ATP-dependent DNA ligase
VNEQEMVIGGYSDPEGTRDQFGSLLLGYYQGPQLHFAGKVGTGFGHDILLSMGKKLRSLEIDRSPFYAVDIPQRGLHWVKPELVAQVGYSEWTEEGKLRHPRFIGLRQDKKPKEVTREIPAA